MLFDWMVRICVSVECDWKVFELEFFGFNDWWERWVDFCFFECCVVLEYVFDVVVGVFGLF